MRIWLYGALAIIAIAVLSMLPAFLTPFYVRLGLSVFLAAGMAMSWYILGGMASYYSFGHAAFVGVGAFAGALAIEQFATTHWLGTLLVGAGASMLACAVLAATIGLPLLRLRGHYFTIAMLAVALVCSELTSAFPALRGSIGISLPDIAPASVTSEAFFYWVTLAALVAITAIAAIISKSRLGYGLMAIREDEDAAQMLGVPTTRSKMLAFVISATFAGLMGCLFALNLAYITTESVFSNKLSLDMIVNTLLGGISSIFGPIVGAAAMTLLTKAILGNFIDYHLAITGLIIILVVFLAPEGLIGLTKTLVRRVHTRRTRPS